MANIIVPQRRVWTRQPQFAADLCSEAGDPLFIYNGGAGPVDLVTGASGEYTNSAAPVVTTDGRGVTTTAAAGARLKFAAQLSHSLPNGPWALFADFFAGAVWATSDLGNFILGRNDGVTAGEWQLRCTDQSSTGIKFYQNQSGGASEQKWASAGTLHNRGRVRMIIARRDASSTSLNLWINGVNYGASTLDYGPTLGVPTTASKSIEIGSVSGLATRGLKGQFELLALTSGIFPDSGLVEKFSKSPWQLFARRPRRTIIDFGASSNVYTISPNGSITLIGSVTQLHERSLTPSGSLALTGTNLITFTNGATTYTIIPSGSVTLSGTNNVNRYHLLIPQGNVSLSGNAVERRVRSVLPTGSIAFKGDTTIAEVKVFAPNGTITFNGTAQLYMPGMEIESTKLPLTGVGS